ncbi:MAG: glycogen synthase GlgA [Lachnospiraceae bacterium]
MIKVLFAASEAFPFIKTGGLADVVGALPKMFDKKKYDVRVMLPKYACMDKKWEKKLKYRTHFYTHLGWREQYAGILEMEYEGIPCYFVDSEYYFNGDAPYHMLHEDLEKFAFFDKAVLQSLKALDFQADIIHCHDWQAALIPAYLQTEFKKDPFYANIKTIFTIHNIRYQGRWELGAVKNITGLPDSCFGADGLECYGDGDYLKGGIAYADKVTTVSMNYVNEICTQEGGEGLDGILRKRGRDLSGILNGIDQEVFNPKTDDALKRKFDVHTYKVGKRANKAALQKKFQLPKHNDAFLIGMVSRMTEQKGIDLLMPVMDEILSNKKIQLVISGSGEDKYLNYFKDLAWRHPDQVGLTQGYSEAEAHRIYAGCDAFLMPSLFEPCGLSQLIAMRYGAVPMVRETGGLKDTVEPYNEFEGTGTGFGFRNYNAHEMMHMIRYAANVFRFHRTEWDAMSRRCMRADFSWKKSAREYEKLYDSLVR